MIGRTLSHYQITAELGSGAMGVVYRAEDTRLGRDVALKVLPVEMAADPERLERFKREAQAIAALNHPNIVTIHSVEEADGIHLLTMELVEGKSLDQVLPPGGFELDKLFPLAIQIADALAAAHEKGIVHRDLKPANVMVTEDSRVKVLDLGLAKLAEQEHEAEETQLMTQEGMVLGTVPYMSPEQVQAQSVDHLSDIFSFGILLYEMACGQRPFQGDNAASVISAVLKEQPPSVTQLRAHLPNHLGRIVRRCLEKQPQRRYQSAREIHLELEGLQSELRMSEAAVVEVSTAARAAASETTAARSPARWIGAIAAAVVVGALAASAVFWLRVDRALEPSPVRTTIDIPAGLTLDLADRAIALSADGTQLALVLEEPTSGQQQLFVRSLDLLELRPLAGTEEATYPFWAPDGRALGFFAGSKLKRIDLQSGLVRTLADAPAGRGVLGASSATSSSSPRRTVLCSRSPPTVAPSRRSLLGCTMPSRTACLISCGAAGMSSSRGDTAAAVTKRRSTLSSLRRMS